MLTTSVLFLDPIHGHTGTLQLDARACDDPARGWSQEVAAESAAEEDVRSLGDVPGNKMEANDDYDEMKEKDDSSTTNWSKCGDTSRWRPMDFPLVVSVLVRHKEDAV